MIIKSLIRQYCRRRCSYILNVLLLISCVVIWASRKKSQNFVQPSLLFVSGNSTNCSAVSFNQSRLNCVGEPAKKWCQSERSHCRSSVFIYSNLFAITLSTIIDKTRATSKRSGGENIQDVLNQLESEEYFQFQNGFLQIRCDEEKLNVRFSDNHLDSVFGSMTSFKGCPSIPVITETTIAVRRQDYANIYHTTTDLYTTYALARFFGKDPKTVRILFIDAHPKSNLDPLWSALFHSYTFLGHLNPPQLLFNELIWSQPQHKSEIDIQRYRRDAPSFFDDFRESIVEKFVKNASLERPLNCRAIKIFFLLRQNYVAHPRNPSGKITRQLNNEKQVISFIQNKFSSESNINFTSGFFEQMSIEDQMKIINENDILVGMHGAGLTHVLFMSKGRALIELSTSSWITQVHFELLASSSQMNYKRCVIDNGSPSDPQTIFQCIQEKLKQICPQHKEKINRTQTPNSR